MLKQRNNLKASITGNKTKKLSAAEKIMCEVMQGRLLQGFQRVIFVIFGHILR
jgi:hypothetical protein